MKSKADLISGVLVAVFAFMAGRVSTTLDLPDLPSIVPSIVTVQPPLASDKPRVLFVYETNDKVELPRGQRSIIDSAPFRQWLREQGIEYRFLDPQAEQGTDEGWWYQARDLRDGEQWMYAVSGSKFYAGKWPDDVEAAKVLIGGLK